LQKMPVLLAVKQQGALRVRPTQTAQRAQIATRGRRVRKTGAAKKERNTIRKARLKNACTSRSRRSRNRRQAFRDGQRRCRFEPGQLLCSVGTDNSRSGLFPNHENGPHYECFLDEDTKPAGLDCAAGQRRVNPGRTPIGGCRPACLGPSARLAQEARSRLRRLYGQQMAARLRRHDGTLRL
jgi:hypothetical protein